MTTKRLQKIPAKYRGEVEKDLKHVTSALRSKREALGLTQEEFAEKLGVSPMSIQFIEQGRRFPSLPTLLFIFKVLKIRFDLK